MRVALTIIATLVGLVIISLASAVWYFLLTVALPGFLLVKLVQSLLAMRKAALARRRHG